METTVKNGELNLALQVALQTMKERCVTLQKRLSSVEEENLELKESLETYKTNSATTVGSANGNNSNGGAAELFQLRLQLSEMQRQKSQMTDHINMVSDENRKLWARLSQVAKEHDNFLGSLKNLTHNDDSASINEELTATDSENLLKERGAAARAALTQQNLIRSKTFTQHAPNPNLRHKVLQENTMLGLGMEEQEENIKQVNNDNDNDSDTDMDIKKCYDNMQELHREAKQQHLQLTKALNMLRNNKLVSSPCPDCVKRSKKPEMADKSLETDDSLREFQQIANNKITSPLDDSSQSRLNIIQEKIQADAMDKKCPMCGRVFNSYVSFDAFRQHVELHFVDDNSSTSSSTSNSNEVETSIDRHFEFVSHTVGDF